MPSCGRNIVPCDPKTIAAYPPTEINKQRAVWGPFSDEREPNEFKLTIAHADNDAPLYVWAIQGRHKSQTELITIARGAFEPEGDDLGRGWFALDLDAIRQLDPTEDGRGRVAYAFEKTEAGVSVRMHLDAVDDAGEKVEAGYAYGEDAAGNGFVLFAFPESINDAPLKENVLIRTRWTTNGAGRADVVAVGGDLEGDVARGSQCWDKTFVSTYESFALDGVVFAEAGDVDTCVVDRAELPTDGEIPSETDVQDPHAGIAID